MASSKRGKKNKYGIYVEIPPFPGQLAPRAHRNDKVILNDEQSAWIKKYYPYTPSKIMLQASGLAKNTFFRIIAEMGIKRTHAQRQIMQTYVVQEKSKVTNEKNGWYKYLREVRGFGEKSSKRRDELLASGWSSIKSLRDNNPEKYKALLAKRSKAAKEMYRKEAMRQEYGLTRRTQLHIPFCKFTRTIEDLRWRMKRDGYILGDIREEFGERWTIFYDDDTDRNDRLEQKAIKQGFTIQRLTA